MLKLSLKIKYLLFFIAVFCISQASGWTSVFADFDSASLPHFLPYTYNGITYNDVLYVPYSSNAKVLYYNSSELKPKIGFGGVTNELTQLDGSGYTPSINIAYFYCNPTCSTDPTDTNYTYYANTDWSTPYSNYGTTQNLYQSGNFDYADYRGGLGLVYDGTLLLTANLSGTPPETCIDGILNQDETAIDYGGICGDYLTNDSLINILTPLPASVTSSPVRISGKFAQQSSGWDNVLLYIVDANSGQGQTILVPIPTEYNLDGSWEILTPLTDGQYYVTARLYNSVNYTFGAWYPNENSNAVVFNVGETVLPLACASLDLLCYLKQAFVWLFYPSYSFEGFTDVWENLKTKFPFNYLTYMTSVWSDLESGSGSVNSYSVNIGSNSLVLFSPSMLSTNPVAPMIRNFLSVVIWLFVPFSIYKKVVSLFFKSS